MNHNVRMYVQEGFSRSVFYSGYQPQRGGYACDVMLNDTGSERDWSNPRYDYLYANTEEELLAQLRERYGEGWRAVYGFPT